MIIRKAKPKDAKEIAQINVETWQNAYRVCYVFNGK